MASTHSIGLAGDYAYLTNPTTNELITVDISDPSNLTSPATVSGISNPADVLLNHSTAPHHYAAVFRKPSSLRKAALHPPWMIS